MMVSPNLNSAASVNMLITQPRAMLPPAFRPQIILHHILQPQKLVQQSDYIVLNTTRQQAELHAPSDLLVHVWAYAFFSFDIQPSDPCVTMLLVPVSCTHIALSLSASDMQFASSLIFLPTEKVGVCKFNPPLVSSCHRPPRSVLLLLLWTFSLHSCRFALPAQLPSCPSLWPVLHR